MGDRQGWEQRDGFKAGEDFPSRRLWLIVPFYFCPPRTGLSNCSSEWGHCLSAAQGEEMMLEKLDCALAHWVLGRRGKCSLDSCVYGTCIPVLVAVNISPFSQRGAVLLRTDNSLPSSLAAVFMLRGTPCTAVD